MVTCIIVDDEQHAIDVIAYHVNQTPSLKLLHTCNNPVEALEYLNSNEVQLLFVDIQMPGITGIDLIKTIGHKNTKVILCTAYSEYALEGYDLNVVDYLLKPVSFPRFIKAVQKAIGLIENEAAKSAVKKEENNFFFVKTEQKGKLLKISFDEIDYIESRRNYVAIYKNQKHTMVLSTMKDMMAKLPPDKFLRIHKSFIVAVEKINGTQGNNVNLADYKIPFPVGDNFKEPLKHIVNKKCY